MDNVRTFWTPDQVVLMVNLVNNGYSAAQIATQLGDKSRCAVIGKVHRMGMSLGLERASPPEAMKKPRLSRAKTTKSEKIQARLKQVVPATPMQIGVDLGGQDQSVEWLYDPLSGSIETVSVEQAPSDQNNGCQWPEGALVCGATRAFRSSYCDCHHRKAYNGAAPKARPTTMVMRLAAPYQLGIGDVA